MSSKPSSHFEKPYEIIRPNHYFSLHSDDMAAGRDGYWNRHHHLELILVEKGTLNFFIGDNQVTATEGNIIVVPSMENHMPSRYDNKPLLFWVLGIDDHIYNMQNLHIENMCFHQLVNDSEINSMFNKIIAEEKTFMKEHILYVQSLILQIVITLIRNHTADPAVITKMSPLLDNIINFIHTNYCRQLTLNEIGQHLGVSECYLSRFFKKETGISIVEYINQYRCAKASTLLSMTDYSINTISEACGFSSAEYFSKVFRQYCGHSPKYERLRETQ